MRNGSRVYYWLRMADSLHSDSMVESVRQAICFHSRDHCDSRKQSMNIRFMTAFHRALGFAKTVITGLSKFLCIDVGQ